MINLLHETLEVLKSNGKREEDVLWVGDRKNYHTTWEDFKAKSNKKYDNGFGGSEVYDDILVVGDNWWLERGEYDGSEWWEFKTMPIKPSVKKEINTPFAYYYDDSIWSK